MWNNSKHDAAHEVTLKREHTRSGEGPLVVEFLCRHCRTLHLLIAQLAGPSGFVVVLSWWHFGWEVTTLETEVGQLGAISDSHREDYLTSGQVIFSNDIFFRCILALCLLSKIMVWMVWKR